MNSTCEWENCEKEGIIFACGRDYLGAKGHSTPAWYCEEHAKKVVQEGSPEYVDTCPHCKCNFGVN